MAQVLEQVDEAVMIQCASEELSQLMVETDGYECLSHLLAGNLLTEGDEVM
jgi:hypothetical protein